VTDDTALALAFDRAAGLAAEGGGAPASLDRFARRVVAIGRRVAAAPACPSFGLRPAIEIAGAGRHGVAAILRLVFDSWAAAGATRGGPGERILRFESGALALDVEVAEAPGGGARLSGSVEGAPASATVVVARPRRKAVRVPLRAGGTFEARLSGDAAGATLSIEAGRRTILRTGPIPAAGGARPR